MLHKIQRIKDIGRFADLSHKAPQFSKLSLIYARNGLGKSTICAVLRSATEANPNLIFARKRAGSTAQSEAELLLDGVGVIAFTGGVWKKAPGAIIIFDQEYISRNLHVGESVTRDNKRSLVPVVLGQKGVSLAASVNELDSEQRTLDGEIKQIGSLISARIKAVDARSLKKYCEAKISADIDAQVDQARKDAELGRKATEVSRRKEIAVIAPPDLGPLLILFAETVEHVSEDAIARVRDHLEKHGMSREDTKWLNTGFNLNRLESACPYCDQPIDGLDLIKAYKGYFSSAFTDLHRRCRDANAEVEKLVETDWSAKATALGSDVEFWGSVTRLPVEPVITDSEQGVIETGLLELQSHFETKLENPLETLVPSDASLRKISAAFEILLRVDRDISSCSEVIAEARKSATSVDVAAAEGRLAWLEALQRRRETEVSELVERYIQAITRKSEVDMLKAAAQADLKAFTKDNIGPRQSQINEILKTFSANFRIVDTQATFVGREANAEYAIELSGTRFPVGEKKVDEPCFSTILSAGDKGTLALAFFLAQIKSDPALSDAVIVFDDPFNSQDLGRQFETESQIRSLASQARQVVVFSHDPRFLFNIQKDASGDVTATFQLLCRTDGIGCVSRWDAGEELKQPYVRNAEIIREFATQGAPIKGESLQSTAQAIRPFLEDYMRARMPGRFAENALISEMLPEIKNAGESDPLFSAVAGLNALNEYSRRYMHANAPKPDPSELQAQCQKVVQIVGDY
ncbi:MULTISPECIES: AAA family ATPase [Hyphobacterium]|uniref:AAA family ATPase n=1 Tax=Hyphobacterium vulgare TaxID=1736751 RepID=A0ABV6ZX03_9PROT